MNQEPIIESRAVEPFFKNGYLLACSSTREAIYIDPGDEADLVLQQVEDLGLKLKAIVNTHGHMDHICGIGRVKEKWDIPVYLHAEDQPLYDQLENQARFFGMQYPAAPAVDQYLADRSKLRVGELDIEVHHTPGHAPGHVCLVVGRHVFCGDTVFAGSIGRTDLPGGSLEVLLGSIRDRILPLGDEKILYPGHGPVTTIGQERRSNPFLQDLS